MNAFAIWPEAEPMLRTYLEFAGNPKANRSLFYSWEWLNWVCRQHPEEGLESLAWLIDRAPNEQVLEVIGCGHLQDLLWQHPSYAEQIIAMAKTSRSFYLAARWCELDDEDLGAERANEFQSQLDASPFAAKNGA
ncbi:MAG: hypothetical protein KF892_24105 [Rhizobacter sp.]|uniref:Uncharacterized protein n=1 Tax=Piscinibacter gummiphilus TaxID=946333 RepID=A0ABZ0CPN0_9BURK|nr:hypothetical protein [Piscinibacter gummiphilus]MBX3628115.1 hypothetical protein [Rhizobacter sp.]WOB06932.1 hypothetical protein RXV79_18640 [Piscinibacter gummiphilus]